MIPFVFVCREATHHFGLIVVSLLAERWDPAGGRFVKAT